MKSIFDRVALSNGVVAMNRICRSATEESIYPGGDITPEAVALYSRLAEGGAGLIVSGMVEVSPSGKFIPTVSVAYHDDYAERLAPICEAMRKSGTAFLVQLVHSGFKSRALENPLLSPSPVLAGPGIITREITEDEISGIVTDFANAALKAKLAGADGVQLHNAHGYLPSAFFSPYSNCREDAYGGNRENRARFILEVYDAIRAKTGDDFVIGIKTNCSDLIEPSISIEDCIWLLDRLRRKGLDYAEISAGLIPSELPPDRFIPMPKSDDEPIFYRAAAYIAEHFDMPVYSVCGWRCADVMNRCLNESKLAGISMCRPFIREPDLVRRWASGDLSPAKCISCAGCSKHSGYAAMCREKPEGLNDEVLFGCTLK